MKSKGLIILLLFTTSVLAIAPVSAQEITSTSTYFYKLDAGKTVTWTFAPNKAGDWNCQLSATYLILQKPGKAAFYWRDGSGTWNNPWYTPELKTGKAINVPLHSGSAGINYMISVYNPNTRIPMEISIQIK